MNWDALGAIGEILGAIAVMMTLLYLALQVRQSKKLLEENQRISLSQAYQSRAEMRMESFKVGISQEGGDLLSRFLAVNPEERLANFERLSQSEQVRIQSFHSLNLQAIDNTLYQGSLGLIDESQLEQARNAILTFYPSWVASGAVIPPSVQSWYEENAVDVDA